MEKHLIVVSVDALVYEDLELLSRLPNMGRLLGEGSLVKRMTTVYPSVTHAVHASLMSGNPPARTGICNNEIFIPGRKGLPWYNELGQMRCDTLFHAAHRAGLTTCACRWPLTAGGFDVIDWLVPEVMDIETREEPDPEKLYRRVCTPELFEPIVRPRLKILDAAEKSPAYEIFSLSCAAEIFRTRRPNLLLSHPGMVDHNRHLSGLFTPLVDDALRMTDEWIGWMLQAMEDAGCAGSTSIAVVSDHGHRESCRSIALNAYFARRGLLRVNPDGSLADWDVYCFPSGLSAQVYVRDPARTEEVRSLLEEMRDLGVFGFGEVLSAREALDRYGLAGGFSFVLEGDGCTAFSSDWTGPIVRTDPDAADGKHHSGHGHMPEKGPQPPMVVCGPAFRKGVVLERGSLLDEAPTFAAALGLELPEAQGRPIGALLR